MATNGHGGARGKGSYDLTRFNALRHGILSKHAVLPWEDRGEYEQLLEALIAEHKPKGPTQEHLVEELAIIVWRKARLRLAEQAAHFRALQRSTADEYARTRQAALVLVSAGVQRRIRGEAVSADDAERVAAMRILQDDETKARDALDIVRKDQTDKAYRQALGTLNKEDQANWHHAANSGPFGIALEGPSYLQNARGLEDYIENEILRKYGDLRLELEHHELIQEQSFGEAVDPDALDRLARLEVHLDRKMGRTLTMLYKLKEVSSDIDAE